MERKTTCLPATAADKDPDAPSCPASDAGGTAADLPTLGLALCLLAYATLVHEFGYAFTGLAPDGMPYGTYLSCLARSFGIALGAALLFVPPVRAVRSRRPSTFVLVCLGAMLAFGALFYLSLMVRWPMPAVCLISLFASASAALPIVLCVASLKNLEIGRIAYGLALGIAVCALAEYAGSLAAAALPLGAVAGMHLLLAVGALAIAVRYRPLDRRFDGQTDGTASAAAPSPTAPNADRPPIPWEPIVHFLCYGFAIGFLHTILGVFRILGPERYYFSLAGSALAAVLVVATYTKTAATSREVWTNLRRLVFPLITGFVMITSLFHSFAAYTFLYVSSCYYGCLFVLGCVFAMRQTVVAPSTICTTGFLCIGLGLALGSLCGALPLLLDQRSDQAVLSVCIMTAFTAATIGTFWIGDDHALRTWWGLRRKYTAKQYRDESIRRKCRLLAETYKLSEREEETLLLLAQGRRATQIKDDFSVSINTVRAHIRGIYTKLDVHSVKQLTDMVEKTVL